MENNNGIMYMKPRSKKLVKSYSCYLNGSVLPTTKIKAIKKKIYLLINLYGTLQFR